MLIGTFPAPRLKCSVPIHVAFFELFVYVQVVQSKSSWTTPARVRIAMARGVRFIKNMFRVIALISDACSCLNFATHGEFSVFYRRLQDQPWSNG